MSPTLVTVLVVLFLLGLWMRRISVGSAVIGLMVGLLLGPTAVGAPLADGVQDLVEAVGQSLTAFLGQVSS